MEERSNIIFELIIGTRSLTAIHYLIEEELPKVGDPEDRRLMRDIEGLNILDEIYIICHNRLSNWHLKAAGDIRNFLNKKRLR